MDNKRNKIYQLFLASCVNNSKTVEDISQLGYRLMRKAKIHHHFFADYSLLTTSRYLVFYALALPHEYENKNYLNKTITIEEAKKIIHLFEKRMTERIPVEYITHEAFYCGNTFYVDERVLIPRSIMSTRFKDFLQLVPWQNHRVLDLCTGSGCIGITLALLNPHIQVDLSDVSAEALAVAEKNIKMYALENRVKCIQSNLFENISDKYDLIITNPPYVSTRDYEASPAEFKKEPKNALQAGSDGLEIIKKIIEQAKNHLNENGLLIAEVGSPAVKRIKKHYPQVPFQWLKYRNAKGKEAFFSSPGIFICVAQGLPAD